MAFPSTISTLATPQPTDRLNNPSHSQLHQNENAAILEIENFIGSDSSVAGTLQYDIRSPSSNGGGHVQTANKGGTGQTSYNKGDILVALSSSVLSKIAVGLDTQVLSASSVTSSGVQWVNSSNAKIATLTSIITVISPSTSETSILNVTIPASTLGTSNAVLGTVFIDNLADDTQGIRIIGLYGTSSVATINLTSGVITGLHGVIELEIIGANSTASQLGILRMNIERNQLQLLPASVIGAAVFQKSNRINVNSNVNQTLGITFQFTGDAATNRMDTGGATVVKIN